MIHQRTMLTLLLLSLISLGSFSQTKLQNPSFEDTPADATIPQDWLICSPHTTPDILPGFWGVHTPPEEGNTYCGLISRPDGSFESLGQRLLPALEKEQCYRFSLAVAHSKIYAGYNKSLKIQVWIGNEACERDQLIYQSDFIRNTEWETHQIEFLPKSPSHFIIIEVYHPDLKKGVKGNILIDNISTILHCGRV